MNPQSQAGETWTYTVQVAAINAVMAYSNRAVSNNQTLACHGFYNSYVFWGMTGAVSGSGNTEIQVLDRQPMPVDGAKAFAWQGVWTGISPVEFATCEVSGITRCYALSDDGTGVIRIIEAFQALGLTGSTSMRSVGPGIANALFATALGLFAAIPAAVSYNYFGHLIREMGARMEDFSLEFLNATERMFEN